MSTVILRASEETVKQVTPEKWIFQVPDRHELRADLGSVPSCIEKACREVLSVIDLSEEALVKEFSRNKLPSGAEVPVFGSWVCSEQHDRYMIPYLIRTPPLLVLLLAHSRTITIPDHVAVTDAHMMYRTYLAALDFKARNAPTDSEFCDRVQAAMNRYELYAGQAEDWMAGMLTKIPKFKEIAALAPKEPEATHVPNFGKFFDTKGLEEFVRAHIGLMNALLCSAEIAIIRALGVRPASARAAKLINTDPDSVLLGDGDAHTVYADMLRAQEATFRSQLRVETKALIPEMFPSQPAVTPFVASQVISPEFIFLNYGLMCMALMR